MPQSATNESSISLVYGTDAMLPVEIGEPCLRKETYDENMNQHNLCVSLELLVELRDKAQIRNMTAK